jgi:hypothetical protein
MTISKTAQIERDYARVVKTRPWLIPVAWRAPKILAEVAVVDSTMIQAINEHNARLKKAYDKRSQRAKARAAAIDDPDAKLPRGWRSRELRANRSSPGSSEALRKYHQARQRSRARITWGGYW